MVENMKEELQNLKPVLITKTAETEEIMKRVEIEIEGFFNEIEK